MSTAGDNASRAAKSDIVLNVTDLRIVLDPSGIDIDDDVSFAIHEGEVLGLVGESASGKTTAATSLLAYQRRGAKVSEGRIEIAGTDVLAAQGSSLRRIRGGLISYVPQDASAALNPALRIGSFSGGNQQKLVLAREIDSDPRVLLIGQPTRGVDIGAIEFIHRQLVALRDAGKALLLVSVELEEILGLADRVLVMSAGEIVGEIASADATEKKVGLMMAGVKGEGHA